MMRLRTWLGVVSITGTTAILVSACSPAAWDNEIDPAADGGTGAATPGACNPSAPKKLEGIDIATLEACCAEGATGAAHCVPGDKTPASYQKSTAPCGTGGFCIPDALIKTNGAKAPSCKSAYGDGACVSVCIPRIAANKGSLKKETCAGADEVCAPCISPLDNKSTGACEIGQPKPGDDACAAGDGGTGGSTGTTPEAVACPYTGPLVDVTKFPQCDPAGARCVPEAQVPEKQRSLLKKCDTGLCVPDPILAHKGQYIPPTCASVAGNEGRCLHLSIPFVSAKASSLPRDTCAADEKCVPCTDPIEGKETGACKLACDPGPKKPPVTFASCCGGLAKCVPLSSVPAAQQSQLNDDGCDDGKEKCVPKEMLTGTLQPQKCKASFLGGGGPGVCLSKCLEFGFVQSFGISQQDCDGDHVCVPCTSGGKPTGAPGCN
jgi:hypothetical protein